VVLARRGRCLRKVELCGLSITYQTTSAAKRNEQKHDLIASTGFIPATSGLQYTAVCSVGLECLFVLDDDDGAGTRRFFP